MKFAYLGLSLSVLFLTGCQTAAALIDSDSIDYKSTKEGRRLELPPDLTAPKVSDRFKGSVSANEFNVATNNPTTAVLPEIKTARLERIGNQRYLAVDLPADKVFPHLVEFWQELGFTIAVNSPATGVIETDWAENKAKKPSNGFDSFMSRMFSALVDTDERDMFKTKIDRAVGNPNATEIYLTHRGTKRVLEGSSKDPQGVKVQDRGQSLELENDMLRRMLLKFGLEENRAKAIVAAGGSLEPKAVYANGAITVKDTFENAYRLTGLALDRNGFTIEDRNFSQGAFFVRYSRVIQDSDMSWWRRTFTSEKERKEASNPYTVTLAKNDANNATRLTIKPTDGSTANADLVEKMLKILAEELK